METPPAFQRPVAFLRYCSNPAKREKHTVPTPSQKEEEDMDQHSSEAL
jgi:hypothetical protein